MIPTKLVVLLSSLVVSGAALAQTKAPEPDYTLSYNIGAVTDYRYRGISQTALRPALQGGADYAHKSGFYAGTWSSTIRWIKDTPPTDRGSVEVDLYAGYKGSIGAVDGLGFDVGGLYYWYVNNNLKRATGENANTFELYGALTYGPATLKYSHALTTLFGTPNSENSGYLDLSATFETGMWGITLTPHVGRQWIRNTGHYTDYSLTAGKDLGDGLVVSLAVVGTNFEDRFGFPYTLVGSGSRDLGKTGLVLGVKKTF
ncbi:MAG TPA: TorF family putative porin [Ramlibacter sp.]|nr:TorF family putative porin [Ramlibacter sp.]